MIKEKRGLMMKILAICIVAILILGGIFGIVISQKNKTSPKAIAGKIAALRELEFQTAYLEENQKKADYQALHQLLEREEAVTWLFAGDSITHGCSHTGYWRNFEELFEQFIKSSAPGRKQDTVINTAVSSATTQDMMTYYDAWIESADADVAFLSFGTNDSTAKNMTPKIYEENLLYAIKTLRAQGVIPILQTPNVNQRQGKMKPYLAKMRSIAEKENVLLIDINQYWKENKKATSLMMNDALHPNAAGHITWCRFLLKSLGIYSEESALAKLSYADVAFPYELEQAKYDIEKQQQASVLLEPYLNNQSPVTWVFTGGITTEGPVTSNPAARNYVSHFNEAVRWETASENLINRCKKVINSGRAGYMPKDILENYEELAGRFQPNVVVYLPDLFGADGTLVSIADTGEGGWFYQDLMSLAHTVKDNGAIFMALTPSGVINRELEQGVAQALQDVCAQTGGIFLDTASIIGSQALDMASAEYQFELARAIVLSVCELPDGSRMK